MTVSRTILALAGAAATLAAAPASAQFFLQSHDFHDLPAHGDEPGIGQPMPGATEAELTAGLVWNLRAALNIAALQCQFEPTLMTVPNYNSIMINHKDELARTLDTLTRYFNREFKNKKDGLTAFDQFGTRIYSSFSTANAQYGFCQTAGSVGTDAAFQKRGSLAAVAHGRMRELRNSLVPFGEQRVSRKLRFDGKVLLPRFDAICWDRKGRWNDRKCGTMRLTYQ